MTVQDTHEESWTNFITTVSQGISIQNMAYKVVTYTSESEKDRAQEILPKDTNG